MTTTDAAPKATEATRFAYQGEFIDLDPAVGATLLAEYREAARNLHVAKARAFEIEEKIKNEMGGYENARVAGEVVFQWKWKDATKFDKKGITAAFPQIVEQFTTKVKDATRSFTARGVVGVD